MGNQLPSYRFTIRESQPGARSSAVIARGARRLGFQKVSAVLRSEIYFVRGNIAPGELDLLGRFLFSDPVTQTFGVEPSLGSSRAEGGNVVEVTYHPGVTDPVADEILRSARELGVTGIDAATTGQRYEIACSGGAALSDDELRLLAAKLLANPVTQRYSIGRVEPSFPALDEGAASIERIPIHSLDGEGLKALNGERRAALDFAELLALRDYFAAEGRACTDVEFEMLAQTWSEHCFHKTFKAIVDVDRGETGGLPSRVDNILRTYIKAATDEIAAPWVVSAFKDNAGIIEFDDDFDISIKVETHNHPSAIEPFGGANTGVGGVIRDVMAVSAKPIAVTDVLCFGMPGSGEGGAAAGGLTSEHIRSGVVAGVQDYGNKMGIPTVNGGIHYHEKYASNPLVYCGCVGIAPKGAFFSKPGVGDRIVVLGGGTGRDGIRGATFSSMTMDGATFDVAGTSVQIGAPLIEKKVAEVIQAARDAGLYTMITDCGAGGLSSAVGEMASELGAEIELSEVRLKYSGLAPWEIWLSEAQERMVIAVPQANMGRVAQLCLGDDVEFCDLGSFTGDGRLVVRYRGETIIDLSCEFLHGGMPRRRLTAAPPKKLEAMDGGAELGGAGSADLGRLFLAVMSHGAVASKEWAVRRYDHEVQGATKIGPFAGPRQAGPGDAAVIKPLGTKGNKGIAISNGFNPRYGEADSYNAAASALDEAVRNAVASGADPDRIAVVDNFCWGDPLKPENMWSLLRAAKACRDAAVAHRTPFISGKDSFNNEFEGPDGSRIAIPPSLLISAMGIVPDIALSPTTDLKSESGTLYLIGEFVPTYSASVLQDIQSAGKENPGSGLAGRGGPGPAFSPAAPAVYRKFHASIRRSLVLSCHDLSDGGLGAALAEMCIGGNRGAELDLEAVEKAAFALSPIGEPKAMEATRKSRETVLLFGETNGCLLAEVAAAKMEEFEAAMAGTPCERIGRVVGGAAPGDAAFGGAGNSACVSIKLRGKEIASVEIAELEKAFLEETMIALDDSAEDKATIGERR